jgi:hypothetical protein
MAHEPPPAPSHSNAKKDDRWNTKRDEEANTEERSRVSANGRRHIHCLDRVHVAPSIVEADSLPESFDHAVKLYTGVYDGASAGKIF